MSLREDAAPDLLEEMEHLLDERRLGDCVRLELSDSASAEMEGFLRIALGLDEIDIIRQPGPLELSAFFRLTDRPAADALKYEAWPPLPSPAIPAGASMFDVLAAGDVLLCHPYESFDPVVGCCRKRRGIRTCWRSSRRCTGQRGTARSSKP